MRGFQTPTPKSSAFGGCAEIFRARDRACGCWHSCACRSHPGFRQEDYDRIVAELLPRQLLEWLALEEQVGVRNQMDIHSVPPRQPVHIPVFAQANSSGWRCLLSAAGRVALRRHVRGACP
ncbi:hypothetical protein MPLSOD_200004 [Mesorhizobium sp. SOD10]|nr:hypothetical protein MPLSOD_200004 [Mesorhizobium sp. SOD10]